MDSVGLGSELRISMIFSSPSRGSSVTFLVVGSQTPTGISSWPSAARLISSLHYAYMSQQVGGLKGSFNLIRYLWYWRNALNRESWDGRR